MSRLLKLDSGDDGGDVPLEGIIAGVARDYVRSVAIGGGDVAYRSRAGFSVKAFLVSLAAATILAACGGGTSALPTVPAQAAATRQAPPTEPAAAAIVPEATVAASASTLEDAVQAAPEPAVPTAIAPSPSVPPTLGASDGGSGQSSTSVPPTVPATVAPPPTQAPPTPTPQPNVQIYNDPVNGSVYVKGDILLAGIVNRGKASANDVFTRFLVGGKEVYSCTVQELKPNDFSFCAVSLSTIGPKYSLASGSHDVIVATNEVSFTGKLNLNFPELTKPSAELPKPTPAAPSAPVNLPDLAPYTPEGWSAPVVLLSDGGEVLDSGTPYQPSRKVGFALKNDSSEAVNRTVRYSLLVNGQNAQSFSVPKLGPGEIVSETVSLDRIVAGLKLRSSDRHVFELVIDPDNEVREPETGEGEANRYSASPLKIKVAKAPIPRRAPQSATEAKIQEAFDNFTWYTSANAPELVGIAKEVLKDVSIDWSRIRVSVLPFDEFNEKYAALETTSGPPTEVLRGYGFVKGTTRLQEVYLREGILPQVLPTLFREVSGAHYPTTNLSGARKTASLTGGAQEFFAGLFEAYGTAVLIEDFGWEGLTNVSYLVGGNTINSFVSDLELRGLWAAAIDENYEDGNVPSNVLLRLYDDLIRMPDPTNYLVTLGDKAKSLGRNRLIDIVGSRLVDKESTLLPDVTSKRFNPARPSVGFTLDNVIANQDWIAYPLPFSTN